MKIRLLYLSIVLIISLSCSEKQITIYTIGDSTMANKKAEVYPETGWGQVFGSFLKANIIVSNHAVNGRSTKSFIDEGRWQAVLDSIQPGDYVFIQFGHNDQKKYDSTRYTTPFGTYTKNLRKFITESREKGATPVLLTSIIRRKFDESGKLIDTHGDYPEATRNVADEYSVPLIDLQKLTASLIEPMGDETSKKMYLWTAPTEKYPDGRKDDTHLNEEGALVVASLVIKELKHSEIPLARFIK